MNNLIPDNVMGLKILNGNVQLEVVLLIIWKPLSLKMSTTLRVRQCFVQKSRTKRCRSREEFVQVIVFAFNTFVFSVLYIISCISYVFYIC